MNANRPSLTPALLENWLRATHEKTGRWPFHNDGCDKPVYATDENGAIVLMEGEVWHNISVNMGLRGRGWKDRKIKTITQFRKKHGLGKVRKKQETPLTSELLENWLRATHQVTGRWAQDGDNRGPVYATTKTGHIIRMKNEVWHNISQSLRGQSRGWNGPDVRSLIDFREKNGLGAVKRPKKTPLTHDLLENWLRATHEKTGRWPIDNDGPDKPVYAYDATGQITVVAGEVWRNIGVNMSNGGREWSDAEIKSVSQFRKSLDLGGETRGGPYRRKASLATPAA